MQAVCWSSPRQICFERAALLLKDWGIECGLCCPHANLLTGKHVGEAPLNNTCPVTGGFDG
jgi:hypothetical protein